MGGVPTVEVICDDYMTKTSINTSIENYVVNGIITEAEYLPDHGWTDLGMSIWATNL